MTSTITLAASATFIFINPDKVSSNGNKLDSPKIPRITDDKQCDVTLLVGQQRMTIHAQKTLLLKVPAFRKELQKPCTSSTKYTFELPRLQSNAMNHVLDYLHTDRLEIPLQVAQIHEILKVLQEFQLGALHLKLTIKQLLEEHATQDSAAAATDQILSSSNCFHIYKIAEELLPDLQPSVDGFIMKQVLVGVELPEIYDFEIDQVLQFVTNFSNTASTSKEQLAIFKTGLKWIKQSELSRRQHVLRLLKAVNLNILLLEDPLLPFEELGDGTKLRDVPGVAELFDPIIEEIQKLQASTKDEIIDEASAAQDGEGELFNVDPVVQENARIDTTQDDLNNPRRSKRASSKRSLFKDLCLPTADQNSTQRDEEPVMDSVNDNDVDNAGGIGNEQPQASFEQPHTSSKSSKRNSRREINTTTTTPCASTTSCEPTTNSSQMMMADIKKRRLMVRLDPLPPSLHNEQLVSNGIAPCTSQSAQQPQQLPIFKILYPVQSEGQMHLVSYDSKTNQLPNQEFQLSTARELSSIVLTSSSHVYDIGGRNPKLKKSKKYEFDVGVVEIFNKLKNTSTSTSTSGDGMNIAGEFGPSMNEPRREFATVVLNNTIFAIGGCQGPNVTNVVETLQIPEEGIRGHPPKWVKRSSRYLNSVRGAHAASVLDNKIFVVGGIGAEYSKLQTIEIYSPESDKWVYGDCLVEGRGFHKTAICNGKLYAAGGMGYGRVVLDTVEMYDPAVNKWESVADMNCPRKCFGLIESNGIFIAIGGNTDSNIQSLEFYDPREGDWQLLPWPTNLDSTASFWSSIAFP